MDKIYDNKGIRSGYHLPIVYGAFFACIMVILCAGCKKFVEIPPPVTQTVTASVFSNNATATSAQLNIYYQMQSNAEGYSLAVNTGLLGDELMNYSTSVNNQQFYSNSMNAMNITQPWVGAYNYIYQANAVIAGLQANSGVSAAVKQQLTGEAYFVRGFWNFYLTNCYVNVPLALTTDYTVTSTLARSPQQSVYLQIVNDLKTAEQMLNKNYVDASDTASTTARIRPNYYVAAALLARVYLYTGDYKDAAAQASLVIGNSLYSLVPDPNNVFLVNSTEAIWQLQTPLPVSSGATPDGVGFILITAPSNYAVSTQLLSAFENGDTRRSKWIGSYSSGGNTWYFPYKYKYNNNNDNGTVYEYTMVFRLAEQYLIRAEAEANNSDPADAVSDLNKIRNRAGLPNYSGATDAASLNAAILHERQVELFTEWGHRWFDLIRTKNVNTVMSIVTPTKQGTWNPDGYQALFPIPLTEINTDHNLIQNPGY